MLELDFAKSGGLLPVIVQDCASNRVLMLAYVNQEAFDETVRTKRACYYSRSRQKLWRKGEESGNYQLIKEIQVDCDLDTLIYLVEQVGGAACHTGHESCFYRSLAGENWQDNGTAVKFDPQAIYKK